MSKGNDFKKYKILFSVLSKLFSFFPKSANVFFLRVFRNCPTKIGVGFRYSILKNLCLKLGENVVIFENVIFDAPHMMEIGNNVSINPFCYIAGEITIGNDVSIAHTTALHSANHTWEDANLPIRYNPIYTKRIVIEDDVWIACNCVILSGVTIGKRSVIGAGSIVNKSFNANSLIVGNPARFIKNI